MDNNGEVVMRLPRIVFGSIVCVLSAIVGVASARRLVVWLSNPEFRCGYNLTNAIDFLLFCAFALACLLAGIYLVVGPLARKRLYFSCVYGVLLLSTILLLRWFVFGSPQCPYVPH